MVRRRKWLSGAIAITLIVIPGLALAENAEAPMKENRRTGILVVAHGSPNPHWYQPVEDLVRKVQTPYPLELAFLDFVPGRSVEDAVKRLEKTGAQEALAIYFSPSSYSNHYEEMRYLLGLETNIGKEFVEDKTPISSSIKRFALAPAMDASPLISEILLERAQEISTNPSEEVVILVAHGPVEEIENIVWLGVLSNHARYIKRKGRFKEVKEITMRLDAMDIIRLHASRQIRKALEHYSQHGRVLVVCYMLSWGYPQEELRSWLEELDYTLNDKGLIPHANLIRWIEQTIARGMDQPKPPPIPRTWTMKKVEEALIEKMKSSMSQPSGPPPKAPRPDSPQKPLH